MEVRHLWKFTGFNVRECQVDIGSILKLEKMKSISTI